MLGENAIIIWNTKTRNVMDIFEEMYLQFGSKIPLFLCPNFEAKITALK